MAQLELTGGWDATWTLSTAGSFSGRPDRAAGPHPTATMTSLAESAPATRDDHPCSLNPVGRGLYTFEHPLTESADGDYGAISRQVTVPEDWDGPVKLSFFATDTHHGRDYRAEDWAIIVNADIFVGHRFLQVLVDGQVVWEKDVADSDSPDWPNKDNWDEWNDLNRPGFMDYYHEADLSEYVTPGDTFELTLRVYDKVGSGTALPDDVHQRAFWDPEDIDPDELAGQFDCMAFWGDVVLFTGQDCPQEVHFEQQYTLRDVPTPSYDRVHEVRLDIARADVLPKDMPYPICGGVPFPRSLVQDDSQIALYDVDGQELPVQVEIVSRWPSQAGDEGSVQWAWLLFMASPGTKQVLMKCGPDVQRTTPHTSLSVKDHDGKVQIDTGRLHVQLGTGDSLIDSFGIHGGHSFGPVYGALTRQLLGQTQRHTTCVTSVTVEESGPVRAAVRIQGDMKEPGGERFGAFTARLWTWADSPLMQLSYRIFHQTDQRVEILEDSSLHIRTALSTQPMGGFSEQTYDLAVPANQVPKIELSQATADAYTIATRRHKMDEEGTHASGWFRAKGTSEEGVVGELLGGIRWMWQQFPNGMTISPDEVELGLFHQPKTVPDFHLDYPIWLMTRGEAKRHQVWLMPTDGAATAGQTTALHEAFSVRPHLYNRQWFADSKAIGNFAEHNGEQFAEVDRYVRTFDETELACDLYGIRDFRETLWCQNYRGRAANGLLEYFSSGRYEWCEYFEQVLHHNLDVDTIHYDPDHPEWEGGLRRYGPFHTAREAAGPISSNCQDQFLHYLFVGEPDSLDQAVAAADYLVRRLPEWRPGRSARAKGWPLAQMSSAYLYTGQHRYLDTINDLLAQTRRYTHPRRGAFDEVHGCFSNRGITTFMTGFLGYGLIRAHQATGYEQAARLLLAMTEAVVSETSAGKGGLFWYSPSPVARQAGSARFSWLVGGMLGYCYQITGDAWFAEQAKKCCQAVIADGITPHVQEDILTMGPTLDMCPLLGEMLAGLKTAADVDDIDISDI